MPIFSFKKTKYWIILVGFLITPFLLEFITQEYVLEPSVWKLSHNTLVQDSPSLVFVGSSRFYSGIRADKLTEPAVVLSLPFLNSIHMLEIIKANIDSLAKAKKVFLEISPEGFAIDSMKLFFGQEKRLRDLGVPVNYDFSSLLNYDKRSFNFFFPSLFSFRWNPDAVKYRFFTERNEPLIHLKRYGFLPQNFKKDLKKSTLVWIKQVIDNIETTNVSDANDRAFHEILRLLDDRSVNFIFILMPVGEDYEAWRRLYFNDFYSETLADTVVSSRLLNLSGTVGESDFADSNHLTPSGAAKLTSKIR